jgi:hypothetical protein
MALPLLLSFLGGGLAKAGVLGAAGSFLANPLIMSAIGSGLGTAIETGDIKKGLASGLGSFAGGKLLGGMMGGAAGAGGAGTTATNAVSGPMGSALRPMIRPEGLGAAAAAPAGAAGFMGGRAGDVLRSGMEFGSSAQGIGSMFGSAAGSALMPSKAPSSGETPDISQFRPMQRQVRTPGPGFVPGVSGEFDYGVSTPYTTDYMSQYSPRGMAMGGMVENPYAQQYAEQRQGMMPQPMGMAMGGQVQRMVPGYGPVAMQAGGIAEVGAAAPAAAAPNEREVISAAVAAVKGQHPRPEIALGAFLAQYGEEALRNLVDRVQSGEFEDTQERFANGENGTVRGPGDGTGVDDMVPAVVDGQSDVLLSDGEFVLRKDATDALNGEFGPEFTDRMNRAGPRAPQAVKQMVAA